MSSGDTLGVFQMESPGMRNLNRMLATRDLATALAAVALIRPGPAASGMKERFCRRARGLEAVTYSDPRLEPVLRETFGVPLYEEDVMRIAATVTGLALEDGDVLRRAIAGGSATSREEMRGVFLARAHRQGYRPETARAIWDGLLQFGSFLLQAHAAGYGVLAWQAVAPGATAEFAVALRTTTPVCTTSAHLEDAKRRGVAVLLPEEPFGGDLYRRARRDRIGLERVRGLRVTPATRSSSSAVAALREPGGLPCRVPVTRPELEALVAAGAFDFTGRTRPELFCLAASAFALFRRAGRREANARDRATDDAGVQRATAADLFELEALPHASWETPAIAEFSREERLWLEWYVLGLCAHDHPMRAFRNEPPVRATTPLREAETRIGKRVRVAGLVAARRTVPTKQGTQMLFVTLEDETGLLECTLFPPVYARHRGVVRDLGPYVAEGRIEEQYGAPTLNTERIARVRTPAFNASGETRLVRTGDRRTP
jgi:DNA polymerase III alpha subunit